MLAENLIKIGLTNEQIATAAELPVEKVLEIQKKIMKFDIKDLKWIRQPESYSITEDKIEIITKPHTDLWQRTYYHFRNDNAPVLQMNTDEKYFLYNRDCRAEAERL